MNKNNATKHYFNTFHLDEIQQSREEIKFIDTSFHKMFWRCCCNPTGNSQCFSVCPRNAAREDPPRISRGYRVHYVRPFGGSWSFGLFPLRRQGPDPSKKWHVHVGDGLLWNRKQSGDPEAAARCCKFS